MQVQIVEKPLKYGGRKYAIGEPVKMTDKHGRLFIAIGRACLPKPPRADIPASPSLPVTIVEARAEKEPEVQPEIETEIAEKSGGDYETEDMEAEEISPRTGRPKRQYRRRDMQAEGE